MFMPIEIVDSTMLLSPPRRIEAMRCYNHICRKETKDVVAQRGEWPGNVMPAGNSGQCILQTEQQNRDGIQIFI